MGTIKEEHSNYDPDSFFTKYSDTCMHTKGFKCLHDDFCIRACKFWDVMKFKTTCGLKPT